VVSGRPADVPDADSIVGLLINTVPVRAKVTPTTTTTELLAQLQGVHNHTLEHQHLALRDIHRMTGLQRLFDSVFVYENYPSGTAGSGSGDELVVTDVAIRDYYHYPLAIQAIPGPQLDVRVQFRTDVFDVATIDALIEAYQRVLVSMAADPAQRLSAIDHLDGAEAQLGELRSRALPHSVTTTRSAVDRDDSADPSRAPATFTERIVAGIYAEVLGLSKVGVGESFFDLGGDSLSAMRAVSAVNEALDSDLALSSLFSAPSVAELSALLADAKSAATTYRA
jgi:acyl carrier protein